MQYKIGDKVSFLNEEGKGIITNILSDYRVSVTNEDGFEIPYSTNEIVPFTSKSSYHVDNNLSNKWQDEKEIKEIKPPSLTKDEVWEVDLHLHELSTLNSFATDHEKLTHQLKHFRKCMEVARNYRVTKIIFIHGIGKGTLKQEITHALSSYSKINYYDAPYKKYGFGATTVEFF